MKASRQTNTEPGRCNRREALKTGGTIAAASALAGVSVPMVHAGEDNTIRLALIGSGSRGSGAVGNAFAAADGPIKLVAMADIQENRLKGSHKALSDKFGDKVDVPPERQFVGFDAYRKAIDCLLPGDIAMLTTHAGFRRVHLDYAVDKGMNVFMEKSFAPDPGGLKRMLRAGERAKKKNLKIAAGLMCRHSPNRQALIQKIRDGALGEVLYIQAYRLGGGGVLPPCPPDRNELLWQAARPGSSHLLWAASGLMIELLIHQIDECCWLKDAWPVSVHGVGGRVPEKKDCGQNHHAYAMEFTFPDGAVARVDNRNTPRCYSDFVTYFHATKCAAQFSGPIHRSDVHIFKDQRLESDHITWKAEPEKKPLHQYEWEVLLDAIRNDTPHNETDRAIYANLAAVMGRAAVHSGQIITWEQATASDFQFVENVDDLDYDSPAPVKADEEGRYPVPVPGQWQEI
ncbi:MAG: Gfo/Idh/MocA family protein [Pirellulaceae bacterium]